MERQVGFSYVLIFSACDIGLPLKLFSETRRNPPSLLGEQRRTSHGRTSQRRTSWMAEHEHQVIGTKCTAVTIPASLSHRLWDAGHHPAAPPSAISRLTPGRCRCGNRAILGKPGRGGRWRAGAVRAAAGEGRSGAGAVPGIRGGASGSADKMDEFQTGEEVTGWGLRGAQLPAWRLLSGPAEGLRRYPSVPIPPFGVPRRHPCLPPPGWSRVSRAPAADGPSLCSAALRSRPLVRVFTGLLDSGLSPCRCRSLGEQGEGCGGLGLPPPWRGKAAASRCSRGREKPVREGVRACGLRRHLLH